MVGEGHTELMTADYSQIEMRIMAHLWHDDGLIEAFRTGEDFHSFVASRAFSVPIEEVTPELRRRVKAMSYGFAYGLSAYGLAAQVKISTEEAKDQMDQYFARFGGVRDYLPKSSTRRAKTAIRRPCSVGGVICRNSTAATVRFARRPTGRRWTRRFRAAPRHHQGRDDRVDKAIKGGAEVTDVAASA